MSIPVALGLFVLMFAVGASATERADLIVTNAHVLTMDSDRTTYENGVIVVQGDTIVDIGSSGLLSQYHADAMVDAGGDIAMPGMINLHNHIPMIAFRGLGVAHNPKANG